MTRTRMRLALGGQLVALCLACGGPGGTPGDLGQGKFYYDCVDNNDAACDTDEVPTRIAVGATFRIDYGTELSFDLNDDDRAVTSLRSASEDLLEQSERSIFTGHQPGHVAVLATRPGDVVEDLLHLQFISPAIQLFEKGEPQDSDLLTVIGETRRVKVKPVDPSDGAILAGGLDCTWTVDKIWEVSVEPEQGDPCRAIIEGRKPGLAIVTVAAASQQIQIVVEVEE